MSAWLKRKWLRLRARMVRERKPPEFIARGWAIGMFYGCTIPFGFQLALSVPTAIALKGSKLGATLGTLITNHFTIFFIYPAQCWFGNEVLRLFGADVAPVGEIVATLDRLGGLSMFAAEFWSGIAELGSAVLASFFIGGAALAAVCTPLTYFGVLHFVRKRRLRRRGRTGHENESERLEA